MIPQDYTATDKKTTANQDEIAFFNSLAESWWDPKGKFAPLHKFNPARLAYLTQKIAAHFNRDLTKPNPFEGLTLLDVGCGGGLLSEPFARLGAHVTGIDAAERNIKTASCHADTMGLSITYKHKTVEEIAEQKRQFDIVLAMEIVEHVDNVSYFLQNLSSVTKEGGLLFMSTLNRTPKSWLFGIIGAEYILQWLPKGTHDWKKFLRPSELILSVQEWNFKVLDVMGITYSPFKDTFSLSPSDLSINYMLYAEKLKAPAHD